MLPASRHSLGFAGLSVFAACLAALSFAGLRAHLPTWTWLFAAVLALAATAVAGGVTARDRPVLVGKDLAGSLAIIAFAVAWVVLLFGRGAVLPPGDPIAVPQFARTLAEGRLLTEAFPVGSSAYAYPPGYPLLLAPLAAKLPGPTLLAVFKLVTMATVALIPAAWAAMHRRLFAPELPGWLLFGSAYAAFFVLERHLGFLTPFAGKNAVHFALLLAPGVLVAAVTLAGTPRLWPLAILPLWGLFLIHYSMLHLAAALLGSFVLLETTTGRMRLAVAGRIAIVGVSASALLLGINVEALHDPRAATGAIDPVRGLRDLMAALVAQRPALVVFHDTNFGIAGSPYRFAQLAACGLLALTIGSRMRRPEIVRPVAVYGLALIASLLFGYGLLPAGITLDFVRSYAWTLQAGFYLSALIAAVVLGMRLRRRARIAALVVVLPLFAMAAANTLRDGRVERGAFAARALEFDQVAAVASALATRGRCALVGDSDALPPTMVVLQRAMAWNYAEAVSGCAFLNGSWVQPGASAGRAVDGLPTVETLRALPSGTDVEFVGAPVRFAAYARSLAAQGDTAQWRPLSTVAGAGLWRRTAPVAEDRRLASS